MTMMKFPALSRPPELKFHHQIQFGVIPKASPFKVVVVGSLLYISSSYHTTSTNFPRCPLSLSLSPLSLSLSYTHTHNTHTHTHHSSLSFIAFGTFSGSHLVRPAPACPCEGVHLRKSLMSSALPFQQCPECLVRLIRMVLETESKWPYSCCFVGCCFQDLFLKARCILVRLPSSFALSQRPYGASIS